MRASPCVYRQPCDKLCAAPGSIYNLAAAVISTILREISSAMTECLQIRREKCRHNLGTEECMIFHRMKRKRAEMRRRT